MKVLSVFNRPKDLENPEIQFYNKSAEVKKPIKRHSRQSKSSSCSSLQLLNLPILAKSDKDQQSDKNHSLKNPVQIRKLSDSKIIKKEQPQKIIKISNVPKFYIVSNDSSEDIFNSQANSQELQAQDIQSLGLDELEQRQQVRVPDASLCGDSAKFKLMSLNMSNDGDASWTLQEQQKSYRKLKSKDAFPMNYIESQFVFSEGSQKVAYLKEKLKCVEKQYSNRN